jgi:hypothetical protein
LQEGPCLIYVFCVCLRIVVSKTYCVFFRLVYPMLPVSLDCSFLMAPSVFSNVYLNINNPIDLFHICHIEGYMFKKNVNKTWSLLQTTGDKDEPNIVFYCVTFTSFR